MTSGLIFDIRRFSIHDGPGIRTTVFFKGCPLSCSWCHNPESQSFRQELIIRYNRCIRCGACLASCARQAISLNDDASTTDRSLCELCGACTEVCPSEARQIVGNKMTVFQVINEITRDLPFFEESGGGITFSGGEPLSQSAFLLELLKACKEIELHTVLDTCGYASWDTLDRVRRYVDVFLYDLKVIDEKEHRKFTGVSNKLILQNLENLVREGHQITVRVPLIPGITDSEENIYNIGSVIAHYSGIERVDLLPYHPTAKSKYHHLQKRYQHPDIESPDEYHIIKLANLLEQFGLQVKIGG